MNPAMIKTTLREIKASLGRYFAILIIVSLGVGFFSGLRVTKPAMLKTGNDYVNAYQLFDFRMISTLGFTKEDVEAIGREQSVASAEGAYNVDVFANYNGNSEYILKMHSLTTGLNQLEVLEGRLPNAANECVIDSDLFRKASLGEKIRLLENENHDYLDYFAYEEYEIVGIVRTPVYLNYQRGGTALGNGSIDGFAYLMEEGFDMEYYMEIYVKLNGKYEIYSQAYQNLIDKKKPELEALLEERANNRYKDIVNDVSKEIEDAEKEVDEKVKEARETLEDAYDELVDGENKIKTNQNKLGNEETKINKGKKELASGKKKLQAGEKKLTAAKKQLAAEKKKLATAKKTLNTQKAATQKQFEETQATLEALESQLKELQEVASALAKQIETLQTQEQAMPKGAERTALANQIFALKEQEATLKIQVTTLSTNLTAGKQELATGKSTAKAEFEKADVAIIKGEAAILAGEKEIEKQDKALEKGKKEIKANEKLLIDGEKQIKSAKSKLGTAKKEIMDGWQEYYDGEEELLENQQEAKEEIDEAKKELSELEEPSTYFLGRDTNISYVNFENDISIIEGIGFVFPFFFLLVAILVCMTTMNRMIDEQRTQIGILKALGYSRRTIMGKYIFYAGSAATIGCLIGYVVGIHIFPFVVWAAYDALYDFAPIEYVFNGKVLFVSLLASLACSVGTTYMSCKNELKTTAAGLVRPKAPKSGKRIFLERITWFWGHLKFLHKVSIRNLFRYKKRLYMMLLGIGGCTALVLTGFGLKDSVGDMANLQYGEIQVFDYAISLDQAYESNEMGGLGEEASQALKDYAYIAQNTVDIKGKTTLSVSMITPADSERFSEFVKLHKGGEEIAFPKEGEAVVCNKIAKKYNLFIGNSITVQNNDYHEATLTVSGICDNYMSNYIYVNEKTYADGFGKMPEYKIVYGYAKENENLYDTASIVAGDENVTIVTIIQDSKNFFAKMLKSLNYVVYFLVLFSGALAFVVLYNLTNINITERVREIATIKVLGFYPGETASYVFRENMVLTGIGTIFGLFLGKILHAFVMSKIDVEMVYFPARIQGISYLYGIILTFVFAMLVNGFMYFKIEKIHMAESLKSVE